MSDRLSFLRPLGRISHTKHRYDAAWRSARRSIQLLLAALLIGGAATAAPAQNVRVMLVSNDAGGDVAARIRSLERMRRSGQRVEIRTGFCMSACTLYLGLPGTCVGPDARFGFHGPSSGVYGVGLPPVEFEHWSRAMAALYPEPIRSWFLREGRLRTVGFFEMSGAELIRLGIPRCT